MGDSKVVLGNKIGMSCHASLLRLFACAGDGQAFARSLDARPPLSLARPSPPLRDRSGNVPALVRLLQAYISRAAPEVATRGYLQVCRELGGRCTA